MMVGGHFETILSWLVVVTWCAYIVAARRQWIRGYTWSGWRILGFTVGVALILASLSPQLVHLAHNDFRGHMIQHLLLGMAAPLGLVFAAPVTLTLRSLGRGARRALLRLLRTRFVYVISHPAVALVLNVGAMYVLYLTPLYGISLTNSVVHAWIHWHFLAAGCIFTWSIAGPDAAPNRPSIQYRFWILFASIASHAALAKIMYAYGWPESAGRGLVEIQEAAQIMYYGGDLIEAILLIALMRIWYRKQGKRERRKIVNLQGA